MQERTYQKASRPELLDELVAATGRSPLAFGVWTGATTRVAFPDDLAEATVAGVVAAHDAAALDTRQAAARLRAAADWQTLRAYLALTVAPTPAQRLAWEQALTRTLGRLTREIADDG